MSNKMNKPNNMKIKISEPKTLKLSVNQVPQIQINSKIKQTPSVQTNQLLYSCNKPVQNKNSIYPSLQAQNHQYQINPNHNNQPDQKSNKQKQPQKQQITRSYFQQYLQNIKDLIFRRKIILFSLNIILTLVALIFAIFFIVIQNSSKDQNQTKIDQMFGSSKSFFTLIFIIFIGVLSGIFSIIIFKGKVAMLHGYWITCLIFLIIFSVIVATTYSFSNMTCQDPPNYILQKVRMTSISASSLFCSDTCPCNRTNNSNLNNNTVNILYNSVQQCPGWNQDLYSDFLALVQENLQCSGWCSVNQFSYFTFFNSPYNIQQGKISCFSAIQDRIEEQRNYIKVFGLLICFLLIIVIFYTNYYIFMQKQDEHRQLKKTNRKMKQFKSKMQDELKTSKRMLQ